MPSQLGQDTFILQLLNGMKDGFFLDSGASDGISASNTFLLETDFGWNGICVEPNEKFYRNLIKNRNCYCKNCCIYIYDGEVEFIEANTLGGILEEYPPELLGTTKRLMKLPLNSTGHPLTVKKQALTLRSILKEFNAPQIIDYWSLDTEGSELSILKTFPFDKYSFRIITVEHNYMPVRSEIKTFLESKGYYRIMQMGIDDCYVKGLALHNNMNWRSKIWATVRR